MQLELSAEDAAFREEMRTFFTTEVPHDIRDAVAARREPSAQGGRQRVWHWRDERPHRP